MIGRNTRLGGALNKIVPIGILLAALYAYASMDQNPSPAKIATAKLEHPDTAFRLYLTTCYKFLHQEEGGTYDDVKRVVTKDDWDWYNTNYDKLHFDQFNVAGGIDPTAAAAIARRGALSGLISTPDPSTTEILTTSTVGDRATFNVRWKQGQKEDLTPIYAEGTVNMIKEDGLWKVQGWGGNRRTLEK